MNRATTSLPVPDSPVISTVVSVEATCVALRSTPRHSTDSPTTREFAPLPSSCERLRTRGRARWPGRGRPRPRAPRSPTVRATRPQRCVQECGEPAVDGRAHAMRVLRPETTPSTRSPVRVTVVSSDPTAAHRRSAHAANHRKVLGRQVADDDVLGERSPAHARAGHPAVAASNTGDQPGRWTHGQRVMRQDPVGDLDSREDGAHVEHFSNRPQKIPKSRYTRRRFPVCSWPTLERRS